MLEPVGDFFVHVLDGQKASSTLVSSNKLLNLDSGGRPTVIHFYDGG